MEMDKLTNSECCFCLICVAKNVTNTPLLTKSQQWSVSDGSRTRHMFVYTKNSHENSHLQSARTLQTTLVLLRVHGRIPSTRVFQNSNFNKYTEDQIRSSHGSRVCGEMKNGFRTVQVRGEIKPGLHTACARKPSDIALLRVRGPNRGINSHGSTCAGHNLVLGRVYQAGSVR